MNQAKTRQWFQARLRWAAMEEGEGLTRWREEEHIFLSESRELAFREALRIGYAQECSLIPQEGDSLPVVDFRFAEVVYLEEQGMEPTAFRVYLGEKEATDAIDFDHIFDPEARAPQPVF